jgi:RNA polymerase sigma-70 factor (ECF subfamily)
MAWTASDHDGGLVRDAAEGDDGAVRTLVDRHLDRVIGLASRMLCDGAEAEDVAQEAFLRLWRGAPNWRDGMPVGPWLMKTAHNLSIDRLRRRRFQAGPPDEHLADPAPTAEAIFARDQETALLEAAIAQLPERQRTALTLVHHLDIGNIEAAKVMGTSVEAIESLLGRARRTLRARLGGGPS